LKSCNSLDSLDSNKNDSNKKQSHEEKKEHECDLDLATVT